MAPYSYKPEDFGADGINATENWRDSGYTHYSAWKQDGGQISWNEVELADGTRDVVDIHISGMNIRRDYG